MSDRQGVDGWELMVGAGGIAALLWYSALAVSADVFIPSLGVAGVVVGALIVRRRYPRAALVAALVAALGAALIDTSPVQLWAAVQLVLLSVALTLGLRRSIGPAVAVGVALYVGEVLLHGELPFSGVALGMLSWTLGVWGLAAAVTAERRQASEWEERARHLHRTREEEIRRHIVEERLRIARDLHDELGHDIAVIGVSAGAAEASLVRDPDGARASLRTVRDATRRVLGELQQILGVLRSDDNPPPLGTISELLESGQRAGLDIVGAPIDTGKLAPDAAVAAYRAVQEALTNAGKHGNGTVTLSAEIRDGVWRLTVRNAVSPDDKPGSGFGLIGMRERVEQAGGALRVLEKGGAFTLTIDLPATDGATG